MKTPSFEEVPEFRAEIDYTNWRGERRSRVITPCNLRFETNNQWHPEPQWILYAYDHEKGTVLAFALSGIHAWLPYVKNDAQASLDLRPEPKEWR